MKGAASTPFKVCTLLFASILVMSACTDLQTEPKRSMVEFKQPSALGRVDIPNICTQRGGLAALLPSRSGKWIDLDVRKLPVQRLQISLSVSLDGLDPNEAPDGIVAPPYPTKINTGYLSCDFAYTLCVENVNRMAGNNRWQRARRAIAFAVCMQENVNCVADHVLRGIPPDYCLNQEATRSSFLGGDAVASMLPIDDCGGGGSGGGGGGGSGPPIFICQQWFYYDNGVAIAEWWECECIAGCNAQ